MRTKIISGFPGIGKTTFYQNTAEPTLDSDSSNFSLITTPTGQIIDNPSFPSNYVLNIKQNIGLHKYLLVSSHKEIRDAMLDNCIFHYLIYPDKSRKKEFIENFKKRGNRETFINKISDNWDNWIDDMENTNVGCVKIKLLDKQYLSDIVDSL